MTKANITRRVRSLATVLALALSLLSTSVPAHGIELKPVYITSYQTSGSGNEVSVEQVTLVHEGFERR